MSTRSTPKHKSAKRKSKSKATEPEVFVLPPNLLEKLGIKLDKIQSAKYNSTDPNIGKDHSSKNSENHTESYDETFYLNSDKSCNNESDSSFLETASLMKESVFLSPTFVPTIAHVIPGEVEIASVNNECKSVNDCPTQEQVNSDRSLQPLIFEPELPNKFELVNIEHNNSFKNIEVQEKICSKEKDSYEYSRTEFVDNETDNILGHSSEDSLDIEPNNINSFSLKLNENAENIKNKKKINIINDEVIDIAKITKLLNFNNNNVLTPVSVGTTLPATKVYNDSFNSKGLQLQINENDEIPKRYMNSMDIQERNHMKKEIELNHDYEENKDHDKTNKINTNVIDNVEVLNKVNGIHDEIDGGKTIYMKQQIKDTDLDHRLHNSTDVASDNFVFISNNNIEDEINLSSVRNLTDHNPQDCIMKDLAIPLASITNNNQQTDTNCEVNLEIEGNTLNKVQLNDLDQAKTSESNESFNNSTKNVTCLLESNILPSNSNKMRGDSESGMIISKLCIQGVEKPGGLETIQNAYPYTENLNKTQTDNKEQILNEDVQISQVRKNNLVMKTHKTYHRKNNGFQNFVSHIKTDTDFNSERSESLENQSNDIVILNGCTSEDYCICNDFGSLRCYDEDDFYEHIHFSQHRKVECELDSILSIYDDNVAFNQCNEENKAHETLKETPEKSAFKICWNNLNDEEEATIPVNIDQDNNVMSITSKFITDIEIAQTNNTYERKKHNTNIEASQEYSKSTEENLSSVINDDVSNQHELFGAKPTEMTNKISEAFLAESDDKRDNMVETKTASKVGENCEATKDDTVEVSKKEGNDGADGENDAIKQLKRKRSIPTATEEGKEEEEPSSKKDVKCGVCSKILASKEWEEHLDKNHCFIAWKAGEIFDIDNEKLYININQKLNDDGALYCSLCSVRFNHCNRFLSHVRDCIKKISDRSSKMCNSSNSASNINPKMTRRLSKFLKCGVCDQCIKGSDWISHICQKHNYIAWESGETPLVVEDEDAITKHLRNMIVGHGPLSCFNCKTDRRYGIKSIKTYLEHIELCISKENTRPEVNSSSTSIHTDEDNNIDEGCSTSLKNADINIVATLTPPVEENAACDWASHKEANSDKHTDSAEKSHMECDETTKSIDVNTEPHSTPPVEQTLLKCDDSSNTMDIDIPSTSTSTDKKKSVKCGVCKKKMEDKEWNDHMQKEHNYLAWKEGESSVDINDPDQAWQHMHAVSKKLGGLVCSKCGLTRKYVKAYLSHIKQCDGMDNSMQADSSVNDTINTSTTLTPKIQKESLKCRENLPKDKSDTDNLPQPSLEENVEKCKDSVDINNEMNSTTSVEEKAAKRVSSNTDEVDVRSRKKIKKAKVKCGVCKEEMERSQWMEHMQNAHNYLAWKDGESPLDLENQDQIWHHLNSVSRKYDGLVCAKCGIVRRYVKAYFSHIKNCDQTDDKIEDDSSINTSLDAANISTQSESLKTKTIASCSTPIVSEKSSKCDNSSNEIEINDLTPSTEERVVICGVCKNEIKDSGWNDHIQNAHDYLAWKEGEETLDLENEEKIWQHLHLISKKCDGLVCSKCGLIRKYPKAYLSHFKQCDGMNSSVITESSVNVNDESEMTSTPLLKRTTGSSMDAETTSNSSFKERIKLASFLTPSTASDIVVKCDVCKQEVNDNVWYEHISKEHDYLAWKEGENPLDLEDKDEVWQYLHAISKKIGGLICSKCGLVRKYVKAYLSHINYCDGTDPNNSMDASCMSEANTSQLEDVDWDCEVKCGVCSETCSHRNWMEHIRIKHDYLAWKEGEPHLDSQDLEALENHLLGITKKYGSLYCRNCGVERKYTSKGVKRYLRHIDICGKEIDDDVDIPTSETAEVKCGVCEQSIIGGSNWVEHIGTKHGYLAWTYGDQPLDLEDPEIIKFHFSKLSKRIETFTCFKCGFSKKYPKKFIDHMKICDASPSNVVSVSNSTGEVECAVCSAKIKPSKWKHHAMEEHYNLAWKVGDHPINLKMPYAVEKYLKEYKQVKGKLVCKKCGISRVSHVGFYAHIVICGKSEEELEQFQNVCEICNNKYVCVYKSQHMAAHREQEYALERKMKLLEKIKGEKEGTPEGDTTGEENNPLGRRKAAVKARSVIEKLKTDEDGNVCATCGFEASTPRKLARHKCAAATTFDSGSESEDSYDSEVDAVVSEEEDNQVEELGEEEEEGGTTKRRRYKESVVTAKDPNLPFKYNKVDSLTEQSEQDFLNIHFTDETLYPEWLHCEYERLEVSQLAGYLPRMEKSCQIKLDHKWDTFERFQVEKYGKGCMFVGGAINCLSWIPARLENKDQGVDEYLAISCHLDADNPRINFDELATHPGLIQIWDLGSLKSALPKLALGIVHDYGTVWAMDWCPSGARENSTMDKKYVRLGLLAVACSNGFVYIYSVPYPSSIVESDNVFFRIKPVAELRISMSAERKTYQASALRWSKQKGHDIIMVGYTDGTTALYDLRSTSPMLKCIENSVTVFYPYLDKRDHNVCITDVDICPSVDLSRGGHVGAVCSGSVAGAVTQIRAQVGQPRITGHASTTMCRFTPGWPSVLVAVVDTIASQSPNELDWYGCGRRVGPIRALCNCQHCSRVLLYTPPLLRFLDGLPPYTDVKKQTIAVIKTSPLTNKRVKANDELAMQVEPLTYDDVVKQYGVEVTLVDNEKNSSISCMREPFTERFPLGEVTAMAFCASGPRHRIAAVGLQAGFVMLLKV